MRVVRQSVQQEATDFLATWIQNLSEDTTRLFSSFCWAERLSLLLAASLLGIGSACLTPGLLVAVQDLVVLACARRATWIVRLRKLHMLLRPEGLTKLS